MQKTIKLTTEQAQQLYSTNPEYRDTLLSDFTDEELGLYKPFTWEDLGKINGFYVTTISGISEKNDYSTISGNRNTLPSTKDVKKQLAEAQLRQLALHYNDGELEEDWIDWKNNRQPKFFAYLEEGILRVGQNFSCNWGSIYFKKEKDLAKCMKDNKQLWLDYCKAN